MTISVPIRSSRTPWLPLGLLLLGGAVAITCVAAETAPLPATVQVGIAPHSIRLPIVDAPDNRFLRLSTAEGVSQTKVDYIVQDDLGFMWFGTHYGLYRYDGYDFKVFVRHRGNPNSLDCTDVRALFKDRDGALWVGCDKSLDKLDQTTEVFKRYPIPLATHITQDASGLLWVATRSGLYRLDPASEEIRHYSHDTDDPSSIGSDDLSYCGEDKSGALWIASSGGLDEFDRRAGKVTRHIVLPDVQGSQAQEGLDFGFYEDRFGVFWIFHSSPNALAVFDRNNNTLTRYAFPEREPTVTRIHGMLEDRNGTLWIATHGLGLLKLDRGQGNFIRYSNVPTDPESLPQDKLDALFADREGHIWVATGRMGPARLATGPAPFTKLPKVPGSSIEPAIGALYEDREGILWMGTPEALIRRDQKTKKITAYRTGGPVTNTDVVAIVEDASSNLWVGTYGHGLHRFDRRTGRFKTYRHNPADPYSLSNDVVMRFLVDHSGTLWAGTADGLDRFDPATERFTTYRHGPQSILIRELVEDRKGNIWIGTDSSGLHRFDPATGQFAIYEHTANVPGTLSDNRVNSVHFDRSGTMWVGTQDGLDSLEPQTGRFSALTQQDGLPGNAVDCILEDKNGNLWMSTNSGVARFNPQLKTFTSYSTAEGLPGPNLTGGAACFQSPSGEMFFGGFNGGTSFSPDKVVDSSYAPPIVLTDFRLFGNPVELGEHSPLQKTISHTSELVLSHQQDVFSIAFAGLSYASPVTNRYRYRLEGLEPDWNEVASNRRQAIYTTLPPGRYTFRAQAATSGGPWSEPGVALRIEILPPWWSTRPFQAAVGTLLFLIAWAAYRQRLNQLARQFEARVAERTRIARELHDTLLQTLHGLLFRFQAVRNLLPRRPDEAMKSLDSAIDDTERALAESRDTIQGLRSEPLAKGSLAELLIAASRELANSGSPVQEPPVFELIEEGDRKALSATTKNEVCRIALEILRNAYRHGRATQIEAEIRYDDQLLRVRIRDNGIGIDPKVLKEGIAGHWGLRGVHERADRIGAKLDFWSEAGAGTEVQLTVKADVAYETSRDGDGSKLFRKVKDRAEHS
jgi:ligand-binding sensor domain-containing protein/signal transduction histidine kinase